MSDPFDLQRFVDAQAHAFDHACDELRAGRKASHWMWFVFPQLRGLGRSATAWRFGIASLDEAHAYLSHHLLGGRLDQATRLVLELRGRSARDIFGAPDDLKFCSSMTLFDQAAPRRVFGEALRRYFEDPDRETLRRLGGFAPPGS